MSGPLACRRRALTPLALAAWFALAAAAPRPTEAGRARGTLAATRVAAARLLARHYRASAPLRRPYLGARDYVAVRDTMIELFARFDPREHFFFGIGRSPTRVIALIQALTADGPLAPGAVTELASSIPGTGLPDSIPAEHLPTVFAHFDRFLPDAVKRGERAIVLVDIVSQGKAVRAMAAALAAYFAARGTPAPRIVRFGYGWWSGPVNGIETVPLEGAAFRALPDSGGHTADFEAHDLARGATLDDLVPNPLNAVLRRDLHDYVRRDRTLDRALASRLPDLVEPRARPPRRPVPVSRALAWQIARPFRPGLVAPRRTGGVLNRSRYGQVRTLALDVLRRYPPDRYRYVGIGPVSTFVLAFLEVLGAQTTYLTGAEAAHVGALGREASRLDRDARNLAVISDGAIRIPTWAGGPVRHVIVGGTSQRRPGRPGWDKEAEFVVGERGHPVVAFLRSTAIVPRTDRPAPAGGATPGRAPSLTRAYRDLRGEFAGWMARDRVLDRFLARPGARWAPEL